MRDEEFALGGVESYHQLGLPFGDEAPQGISFLRHGARRYTERQGLTPYDPSGLSELQADPQFQTKVADKYLGAPVGGHRVQQAFSAFRDETNQQYDYLTKPRTQGGLGVTVEAVDKDPYASHMDMVNDLHNNRRLKVLSTESTGGHPFLSNEENDRFRAVHDAFGHGATGRSFSRHGEEAAFHSHAQMYSSRARPAMAAETRGQNSVFNFRYYGSQFPEQKMALLPDWASGSRIK